MKKRILFRIFPFNQLSFPLLLNVWETEGIDNEFDIKVIRSLEEAGTITSNDIIIYSFMTHHLPIISDEIKLMKSFGAYVAGGGPHISGEIELSQKLGFDFLFSGAGEKTFLEFAHDLLSIKDLKKRVYVSDGSEDFNKYLPISKYMQTRPPLEITRGCHWNCSYCQTGTLKPVHRTIDSIKTYLDELKSRNYNRINFVSPSALEFGSNKPGKINETRLIEFLELVKSYDFNFFEFGVFPSEIRPDIITDKLMKLLKKNVNNKKLTIGAQSGTDKRLKSIHRGHTITDIENGIKIINSNGFLCILDFIIAYPDETMEERQETLDFIHYLLKKHRVKIQFHHFFPISGSELQYRFPSYLKTEEKEKFIKLNLDGGSTISWIIGEKVSKDFFQWCRENHPSYYKLYK